MSETRTIKDLFISYAEADKNMAEQLRSVLTDWFGDRVWIRSLDLDAGTLIADALYTALGESKWLVILLSRASADSKWIRQDANYAAMKGLREDGVQFIVVKLEDCDIPQHLKIPLSGSLEIDIADPKDPNDTFMEVANFIDSSEVQTLVHDVYLGRGDDTDRLSLMLRRNRIVFVLGLRGIGKTRFVEGAVSSLLGKKNLTVRITRGYSADMLSRKIIELTRTVQPIRDDSISDDKLLFLALAALKDRERRVVLFIDDTQTAIDGSNFLRPFLDEFLQAFLNAGINTHVILATTRYPYHHEEINESTEILNLGPIQDIYIREILFRLIQDSGRAEALFAQDDKIDFLVSRLGGHPLATRRMAGLLKVYPLDVLDEQYVSKFQEGIAEYILRNVETDLDELDHTILKALAIIADPVVLSDLLSIELLDRQTEKMEQIHSSIRKLSEWFLIESDGEYLYLHGFLQAFYTSRVQKDPEFRNRIAEEYGEYAMEQANGANRKLNDLFEYAEGDNDQRLMELSNKVYRYALPADRLLRSVGKDSLADKLPILYKGTLREMVFYFYQETDDHLRALSYADRWLKLSPQDTDIQLYRIRCYRKIGDNTSFDTALRLISDLESQHISRGFRSRLFRERAFIAVRRGDREAAKAIFREGIRMESQNRPYSELYTGLARILIEEAEDLAEWDPARDQKAKEALDLLRIAQKESDNFYRFHIGLYVDALILSGEDEIAIPLLREALKMQPGDGRLNFRMAEISRKNRQFESAELYATRSYEAGYASSLVSYANILYDKALSILASDLVAQQSALNDALRKLAVYREQFGSNRSATEIEVVDTIASKIFRALGNLEKASEVVDRPQYAKTGNPYTVYEQALILSLKADSCRNESISQAYTYVNTALERIGRFPYRLPEPLMELKHRLEGTMSEIEQELGQGK